MQFVNGSEKTFVAGAAIGQYLRVTLSTGKLALAGVSDEDLGVTVRASFAANQYQPVRLRTASGTTPYTASKSINQGADVYTAANGKISDSQASGALLVGMALEAASNDGDIIEVLPI
jgi:hypothetical protein